MKTTYQQRKLMILLFLITIIGPIGIDLYLPSLPAIAVNMQVSKSLVKLTITSYLVGLSCSQLLYGPISDLVGRKPALLIGLLIAVMASLCCAFAASIEWLLFFRLVQGLGAGSCSVLSKAIARDNFAGPTLAKVTSYIVVAWAIVPLLAPLVGGYIQKYTLWQNNFLLMFLLQLIVLIAILLFFQDKTDLGSEKFSLRSLIDNYFSVVRNRSFINYVIVMTMANAMVIAYATASPLLLQDQLNLSPAAYGWTAVFVAVSGMLGAFVNSKMVYRFSPHHAVLVGICITFLATAVMLFLALFGIFNVVVLIVPMAIIAFGLGLIYTNCFAQALDIYPNRAGMAGALIGFIQIVGAVIISAIVAALHDINQLPLVIILTLLILSLCLLYFLRHGMLKKDVVV